MTTDVTALDKEVDRDAFVLVKEYATRVIERTFFS